MLTLLLVFIAHAMFNDLHALVYLSRALIQFDKNSIELLAKTSAGKNEQEQISGYLCFKEGLFIQYLEGRKSHLTNLYHSIEADKRHQIIQVIDLGEIARPKFKAWDMRYLDQQELERYKLEDMLDWIIMDMKKESTAHQETIQHITEMVEYIVQLRSRSLIF